MCDGVVKVELTEGNTMIIPTGWIHAVVCRLSIRFFAIPDSSTSILRSTHWSLVVISCILSILVDVGHELSSRYILLVLTWQIELRCRDIEIRTRVPKKFRFPFLTKYASHFPLSQDSEPYPDYVGTRVRSTSGTSKQRMNYLQGSFGLSTHSPGFSWLNRD